MTTKKTRLGLEGGRIFRLDFQQKGRVVIGSNDSMTPRTSRMNAVENTASIHNPAGGKANSERRKA